MLFIIEKYGEKKAGQNRRKSKDGCRFSVKHTRYEMRLNVSLDMMFARLLFQDGAGNCKKKYYSPSKIFELCHAKREFIR